LLMLKKAIWTAALVLSSVVGLVTAAACIDAAESPTPGRTATAAPASQPSPAPSGVPTASNPLSGAADDVPAGGVTISITSGSQARYLVREQLAGASFPNDAVGVTRDVTGKIVLDGEGKVVQGQSTITVGVDTLVSDEGRRDNYVRQNSLQTSRYPDAVLAVTEVQGLPWPLPESGEATFKLLGDMTIRGVTKPLTWDVTARFDGGKVAGLATTAFKFGLFNMSVPRVAVVLSVEDNIRLEIDFSAASGG